MDLLSLSMIVNTMFPGYGGNTQRVKCTLVSGRQTKILGTFCLSASRHRKTTEMTPDDVPVIKQSGLWNCCQLPSNVKTSRI